MGMTNQDFFMHGKELDFIYRAEHDVFEIQDKETGERILFKDFQQFKKDLEEFERNVWEVHQNFTRPYPEIE